MVGRKCLIAFIDRFRLVFQNLSCQKEQSSPTHSVGNHPDITDKPFVKSFSEKEEVVGEEMGNKSLKLPDIDPAAYQERVIDIINEQKTPLKETNFSPYTPLPAIGKSIIENPKCKIVRQKTYRVLEPIYVKGPLDLYKYISKTEREIGAGTSNSVQTRDQNIGYSDKGTFTKRKHISDNHKVAINNDKLSNIMSRERNPKPIFSSKSAPERITRRDLNKLGFINQDMKSNNVEKENAASFWIDF